MWRKWKVGDRVLYIVNDFDGHGTFEGIVTEMHESHAIVEADVFNIHERLWLDDNTQDMFWHR